MGSTTYGTGEVDGMLAAMATGGTDAVGLPSTLADLERQLAEGPLSAEMAPRASVFRAGRGLTA
jgi:hypothetical protein